MADWKLWRALLAGQKVDVREGETHCGYWRMTRKDAMPVPVCIYEDGGALICFEGIYGRDGWREGGRDRAVAIFPWCKAISEAEYRAVAEKGEPWPDIAPAVAKQLEQSRSRIGGNNPPEDAVADLQAKIETAEQDVLALNEIADDVAYGAAATLRDLLYQRAREAEKAREVEKKPHLEAGKVVDAKWQPIVKHAKALADKVNAVMSVFATKKHRAAQEVARVAAETQRRAEQEAADQDVTLAASAAGVRIPELVVPIAPQQIRGGVGRAVTPKIVNIVTGVTNWPVLAGYFIEREEVQNLLMKLAQRAVDDGHTVPGITIEEKAQVGRRAS